MASVTASTTLTTHTGGIPQIRPPLPKTPSATRSLRRPVGTASTPNLNAAYAAQARTTGLAPPAALSRKTSLAALTQSSLASIPDVSEAYAYESVLSERPSSRVNMAPATPGRAVGDDVSVGDTVDVPGGLYGIVRFVGVVQGKKGTFAGVELNPDFAQRGKNSGDVDG
jgi:hypothetical protein